MCHPVKVLKRLAQVVKTATSVTVEKQIGIRQPEKRRTKGRDDGNRVFRIINGGEYREQSARFAAGVELAAGIHLERNPAAAQSVFVMPQAVGHRKQNGNVAKAG